MEEKTVGDYLRESLDEFDLFEETEIVVPTDFPTDWEFVNPPFIPA